MKVLIINPTVYSITQLRSDLFRAIVGRGHEITAAVPEADARKEIEQLGARFYHVPFHRTATNPFSDIRLFFRLRKCIRAERPDLIFSYSAKPVVYGSLAARFTGSRNVYAMIPGLGKTYVKGIRVREKLVKLITRRLMRQALRCCKGVIFQNKDDMQELLNYGAVKAAQCSVVSGSGVNMEKFSRQPLPEGAVFLMVCRIMRDKGVLEFCQAARTIKKQDPSARFVLVGPMEPRDMGIEDLQEYIENGEIDYPGETNDIPRFLKECSVFVLPSAYREGIPHSILEALATGRAIITTDMPGCRETVREGMNGFLIPPRDTNALTEAMRVLSADPGLRAQMGEQSYLYCRERFSVDLVNSEMLRSMDL